MSLCSSGAGFKGHVHHHRPSSACKHSPGSRQPLSPHAASPEPRSSPTSETRITYHPACINSPIIITSTHSANSAKVHRSSHYTVPLAGGAQGGSSYSSSHKVMSSSSSPIPQLDAMLVANEEGEPQLVFHEADVPGLHAGGWQKTAEWFMTR